MMAKYKDAAAIELNSVYQHLFDSSLLRQS
jgi:hypothetical protein